MPKHIMGAIVQAPIHGHIAHLRKGVDQATEFLAINTRRARPKGDRQTGRLQLDVEPVFCEAKYLRYQATTDLKRQGKTVVVLHMTISILALPIVA